MIVSYCPGDSGGSDRELGRSVVRDRCYSAVIGRGRGAKGNACGIALSCISRYICYVGRAGDGRVLGINHRDRLIAGCCVAMIISYCPGDSGCSDRELDRSIVRDRCNSAVISRGRGAKGYTGGIALIEVCGYI